MSQKCLACWHEINKHSKVCPYCGSNQEEIVNYLTLAVIVKNRSPEDLPSDSSIIKYIKEYKKNKVQTINKDINSIHRKPHKPYQPTPSPYRAVHPAGLPVTIPQQTTTIPTNSAKNLTVVCPHCHRTVPEGKFCKYCGKPLKIECPHCHKLVNFDTKFCPYCGVKIEETEK